MINDEIVTATLSLSRKEWEIMILNIKNDIDLIKRDPGSLQFVEIANKVGERILSEIKNKTGIDYT